jgi:hypothetical protein
MARKPKKPKAPKKSSSMAVWERYDQRMQDYKRRLKEYQDAPKKKEAIRRKYQSL